MKEIFKWIYLICYVFPATNQKTSQDSLGKGGGGEGSKHKSVFTQNRLSGRKRKGKKLEYYLVINHGLEYTM